MYLLRKTAGLQLVKDGKVIATFADSNDEDTANTICNILNAEEQRWCPECGGGEYGIYGELGPDPCAVCNRIEGNR